jgi:hypothetical protein
MDGTWLKAFKERAQARSGKFQPITVEERFRGFQRFGFRPHGIYLPNDHDHARTVRTHLTDVIGAIPDEDERLAAYYAFQDETSEWERAGVPGRWTGQQGVARSRARFRVVATGRRWGKTSVAAHEALGIAINRPRSIVWLAAPIARLSGRAYDIVMQLIDDYHIKTLRRRDTNQERMTELENRSRIEGVSLENIKGIAGATVDAVVIDEAEDMDQVAWDRGIEPVLMDRNGQALLISTYSGDEGFFYERAEEARLRQDGTWAYFNERSSDNFYWAPQGEKTPQLIEARRKLAPIEYLEIYGGVAAHGRNVVYPEFKEKVHVMRVPFDPHHPVMLGGDPSAGANEYAIVAVQDYPELERIHVIDEVFQSGGLSDSVIATVKDREWANNVSDVVLDSAMPSEIERWQQKGFNAYGVGSPDSKPHPEDTYPIVRRLFCDPVRYNLYHDEILTWLLKGRGFSREDYDEMSPQAQKDILVDLEEYLNDPFLPQADVEKLRACSRVRVDEGCTNFIAQHKRYRFLEPRTQNKSTSERARKVFDHEVDAFRYLMYQFHRWDDQSDVLRVRALLESDNLIDLRLQNGAEEMRPEPLFPGRNGYLWAMREAHQVSTSRIYRLTAKG